MSLDGVSINFMDYNAVKDGVASEWLESLLKNIKKFNRNNLQLITVLIISPLLVDKMKTFKSP
jgi:hypothetical protein